MDNIHKPTRAEAVSLWKLVTSGQAALVDQALVISESMGEPVHAWLEGLAVNERTGEVMRNIRFTGTRETQDLLDRVLWHQLSLARPGTPAAELKGRIRKLVFTGTTIPTIQGFDGLETLELTLTPPESSADTPILPDLSGFGPLPALKRLSIRAKTLNLGQARRSLSSLAGLHAPQLEEVELSALGLHDIEALGISVELRRVDLSHNPGIGSIAALRPSAGKLQTLHLAGCSQIETLTPLSGATRLQEVHLDGCRRVDSLQPLSGCRQLTLISFSDLPSLKSLDGLVAPHILSNAKDPFVGQFLCISGCSALTSLNGLPPLDPAIQSLNLRGLDALQNLAGLPDCPHLQTLSVGSMSLNDLSDVERMPALKTLEVTHACGLEDLAPVSALPALTSLTLKGCARLRQLPDAWTAPLQVLEVDDCDALTHLGGLPASLTHLRVAGCRSLSAISAREGTARLLLTVTSRLSDDAAQPAYLDDLTALTSAERLEVHYEPESRSQQNSDPRRTVFSQRLANALAGAGAVHLVVNKENSWRDSPLTDFSALATVRSLRSIDLTFCRWVSDLKWLVGLPDVESVMLAPGSEIAKLAGASTHPTADHVKKLQKRLCRKYALPLPEHLNPKGAGTAAPAAKALPKARRAGPDAAALQRLFTGDAASILQGLELLRAYGDPQLEQDVTPALTRGLARLLSSADPLAVQRALETLALGPPPRVFDALAEGVNLAAAYTGDSEAIGRIFKAVPARDRVRARWALTAMLAMAPPQAVYASSVRSGLSRVELTAPHGLPALPPSLSGFTALRELILSCVDCQDLSVLSGVNSLTSLTLDRCSQLTRLEGLQSSAGLVTLSVKGCPKLRDLSALSGMSQLRESTKGSHMYVGLLLDLDHGIDDIGFLPGLKSAERITLHVSPLANLGVLAQNPSMRRVSLKLEAWDMDLSGLLHCEGLEVECEAPGRHRWGYHFASLETLQIRGGQHDFSDLKAPLLTSLSLQKVALESMRGLSSCTRMTLSDVEVGTLEGLGPVRSIRFWDCRVDNLHGLEQAQVESLDLTRGTYRNLTPIGRIQTLRTLQLGSTVSTQSAHELGACPQIRELEIQAYSGSLAFLADWSSLQTLDLRDAGALTDLDALTGLTALKKIYIRGCAIKREGWPPVLRDALDTR
jgi:hypothetical protein